MASSSLPPTSSTKLAAPSRCETYGIQSGSFFPCFRRWSSWSVAA